MAGMSTNDAADAISRQLQKEGYKPSDGHTVTPWDRVFFGKPAPEVRCTRPCVCGAESYYVDRTGYVCGQWQCVGCTRLFAATVAETIGALRGLIAEHLRILEKIDTDAGQQK